MFKLILQHLSGSNLLAALAIAGTVLLAWIFPRMGERFFSKIERFGSRLASRKGPAIVALTLFPILVRISLLPIVPVPVPKTHDEFSYLLAADTFAAHRLTNPPHPMWIFLDTIHVNQDPNYMSKYPPAQGAVLAVGQVLGNPWIGVLLSIGIMCGSVLWMLQGWMPPAWALLGGVMVVLRIAIFSYWMNSYWGGAVPAIGGALIVGSLPRIIHSLRIRYAITMGIGAAVLMNSRPFEGLMLCVPVAMFLASWIISERSPSLSFTFPRLVLPFCILVTLSLGFVAYYNWRGTGNILTMPYALNERMYWSTPTFLWQKLRPPIHFSNPQFEAFYNGWARNLWLQTNSGGLRSIVDHACSVVVKFVYFFLWPELCVVLIASGLVLRDKRVRFLIIEAGFCFITILPIAWFQPHYAAAIMATIFALITQATRHLRHWEVNGKSVGIGLTRVVMIFAVILAPFHPHSATLKHSTPSGIEYRTRIEAQLDSSPGNHLVIVRYSPLHGPLYEWVYNKADIDHAKVVWAREIPGLSLQPLLDYFGGRQIWLVEADSLTPQLLSFHQE
jgi:hypothetical protein